MNESAQAKITEALTALKNAAKATQDKWLAKYGDATDRGTSPYYVELEPVSAEDISAYEKALTASTEGFVFPETYRWFLGEHGLLKIYWGTGEARMELQHMFRPEELVGLINTDLDEPAQASAERCVAFQFESDFAVENFHCFYVDAKAKSEELAVVTYYTDDPFDLSKSQGTKDLLPDFAEHILSRIEEQLELFAEFVP